MKLLDKSFTEQEKHLMLELLEGNINRLCVSDDVEEIICMLGFATSRLSMLAYSRIKELKQRDN